jgi:type IV secretory pathway TrbD component
MQIYRVVDRIPSVTLWHTGHRIARTVAEADPRSYRNGPRA